MKVSGFTFVKNAVKYDYPVIESITSILPLCDEFIVVAGNSEDNTRELLESIRSDKIRIIDSVWDETLRKEGKILAIETNKAFDAVSPVSDWAFYIQADEVVHEKFLSPIKEALYKYKDNKMVEGLLFNYLHFYGSYDYVADSRNWYRREIRIIKNDKSIRSFRDAQGFQKAGKKLFVKHIDAYIYHYGWVKPPAIQQAKQEYFHSLWHNDEWVKSHVPKHNEFDYSQIDSIKHFEETHPKVMNERIKNKNWNFSFDPSYKRISFKFQLLNFVENITGWRVGEYRNYKILK